MEANNSIHANTFVDLLVLGYRYQPTYEIAWTVLIFLAWSSLIWRATFNAGHSRVLKLPHSILVLHIVSSLVELLLYCVPLWRTGGIPSPSALDLGLSIIQSMTGLYLAAFIHLLPRGHLESTRATFQCMAIQRLLASGIAYSTSSTLWYKASIKLLHNFVWARIFIHKAPNYISGLRAFSSRYTTGIIGCHLMGLYEGNYPHGIGIYIGTAGALLALDRWAQTKQNRLIMVLTTLGFVTRVKDSSADDSQKQQ